MRRADTILNQIDPCVYNRMQDVLTATSVVPLGDPIEGEIVMNIVRRGRLAGLLITAMILIVGSSAAGQEWKEMLELTAGYNDFGFSLYEHIAAEKAGENIFISPLSISLALAMARGGAAGGTADEMSEVLGLAGWTGEKIYSANGELMERLGTETEGVTLDIANSLWCRKGLDFDPAFLERTGGYFRAEARSLDFSSADAPGIINGWVSEHTAGMIDEIVRSIDPLTILFIINAVYFKGGWKHPFDSEETREEDFHTARGGVERVDMMHKSGRFFYKRGSCYQAVQLPYGDGRMSMYLFLPDSGVTFEELYDRLPDGDWMRWLGPDNFSRREGSIALPRFRAEFETGLQELLERLGMVKAFDRNEADFSGMTSGGPERVWIDEILHKAVIEVTEKGTEAAAATSVVVVGASISVEEPFEMIFDRPFFFTIWDNATGTILFMGSIADPERPRRDW